MNKKTVLEMIFWLDGVWSRKVEGIELSIIWKSTEDASFGQFGLLESIL